MARLLKFQIKARNEEIRSLRSKEKWTYESIGVKFNLTKARIKQICDGINIVAENKAMIRKDTPWGCVCPKCGNSKVRGRKDCGNHGS